VPIVLKSGSLNLLEPSGPVKACNGIALPFTIAETVKLHRLHWFGHLLGMEENRIPKRVLYMKVETPSLRGRPRNRWQDEVREEE
jgi:hypothetical protein